MPGSYAAREAILLGLANLIIRDAPMPPKLNGRWTLVRADEDCPEYWKRRRFSCPSASRSQRDAAHGGAAFCVPASLNTPPLLAAYCQQCDAELGLGSDLR